MGYKTVCRAEVSGIIYEFEIYMSKGATEPTLLEFSGDIVIKLINNLLAEHTFKLFTDSFFTAYKLFVKLKSIDVQSVFMVRVNKLKGHVSKTENDLKKEGTISVGAHFCLIQIKFFLNLF